MGDEKAYQDWLIRLWWWASCSEIRYAANRLLPMPRCSNVSTEGRCQERAVTQLDPTMAKAVWLCARHDALHQEWRRTLAHELRLSVRR